MKILEQVARAICLVDVFGEGGDIRYTPQQQVDFRWDGYVEDAKAAIQALIDADVPIDMSNNNHHVVNQRRDISTFKAMLKQILENDND